MSKLLECYGWNQAEISADLLNTIEQHTSKWDDVLKVRVELCKTVQGHYSLSCAGNKAGQLAHWLGILGAYVIGANEYDRRDDFTAVYFTI